MTTEEFNRKYRLEIKLCKAVTGEDLQPDPQSDDEALMIGEQLAYLTPTDEKVLVRYPLSGLLLPNGHHKWAVEYMYHSPHYSRDEPPESEIIEHSRHNSLWDAVLAAARMLYDWKVDNICRGIQEQECEPSAEEIAKAIKEE